MEKEIAIKTKGKYKIYGTLNGRSKKLVIFVHGLASTKDEHIFFNSAKFFPKHGFATFRFGLYSGKPSAQKLIESTLKTHAENINIVVKYFTKKYKKIYLVGHSMGGPSVLLANSPVNAVILWDPSSVKILKIFSSYCKYNKHLDAYIIDYGVQTIISKEMYNEFLQSEKWLEAIKKVKAPIKIIGASVSKEMMKGCKSYYKAANSPKQLIFIKNADHTFDREGAEEKLFAETLKWIKKF